MAVAGLLGHDNAALVLATYGQLMPGREDRARRASDVAWLDISDGPQLAPD